MSASPSPLPPPKSATPPAKQARPQRTILHLTPDLDMGQEARNVVDLSLLTHRHGWRPLIASAGGALVLEAERSAIRHTRMPLNKGHFLARWRNRVQLEALVRRTRPSLLHAHGLGMLKTAIALGAMHHIPVLLDLENPIPPTKRNKKLLAFAVSKSVTFRVPSDFMANHLQQDLQLASPRLYRILPGVDLNWYNPSHISAERLQALSRQWRLPEATILLLVATPMMTGFGHKELLHTLAQMKRPDLYTVIVGKGAPDFTRSIEKSILTNGLAGQVIMAETCSDWPSACWLSSLVVAVNTTPRGLAQELLWAQALGRPIIATDVGANRELVKAGETAWLLPPNDEQALTAALSEATQMTTDQRVDVGTRTRAFTTEAFSQTSWASAFFNLYETIWSESN